MSGAQADDSSRATYADARSSPRLDALPRPTLRTPGINQHPCLLGLALALCLLPPVSAQTNLLADVDWRCADKPADNTAFVSDVYNPGSGEIHVTCDFVPGSRVKGELLMSMERFPGLAPFPADLSPSDITFTVEPPPGFSGGVQAMVTSRQGEDHRHWYGGWQNAGGTSPVTVSVSLATTPPEHKDFGFDPSRVIQVGIKLHHQGALNCAGTVRVVDYSISPALATHSLPPCPPSATPGRIPQLGVTSRGLTVDGDRCFLPGMNWRFGYDQSVGTTAWYPNGAGYRHYPLFVRHELTKAAASGARLLRILLFDDGAPLFDAAGELEPFSSFQPDLDVLFAEAESAGVMIQLTLFDYLLFGRETIDGDGEQKRGYRSLVENPAVWSSFIDDILRPLLQQYGSRISVLEPVNEVDWAIAAEHGGGWEDADPEYRDTTPLDYDAFCQAVRDIRSVVQDECPAVLMTLGVSATALDILEPIADQFDFWQLHFYPDSMTSELGEIEDFLASLYAFYPWMNGKPFVLGEYPGNELPDRFLNAVANAPGGAGAYAWNLTPSCSLSLECDPRSMLRAAAPAWLARHRELTLTTWLQCTRPRLQLVSGELHWSGRRGVLYDVLRSPDLQSWTPIGQVPGTDGPCSFPVPTDETAFFRLSLSEDEPAR